MQTSEILPEYVLKPKIATPEWLQGHWYGHGRTLDIFPDGTARLGEIREGEYALELRLRLIIADGDKTKGLVIFQVEERVLDLHPFATNEFFEGMQLLFWSLDGALIGRKGFVANFCSDEAHQTLEDPICGV